MDLYNSTELAITDPSLSSNAELRMALVPAFSEIRLEMTNRCAYHCVVCPREQMNRRVGTMSISDLELALDRIGSHEGMIFLHGFGEALLDSALAEKVSLIADRMPRARIGLYSTLGTSHGSEYFQQLVEAGLREIHVSMHGHSRETYKKAHGVDGFELAKSHLKALATLQHSGKRLSVHVLTTEHAGLNGSDGLAESSFFEWLRGLGLASLRTFKPHNFGRGRHYNKAISTTPCSIAWGTYRNFLQVSWNLNVIPCCLYFNDDVILGNLRTQTLEEIFSGESYLRFVHCHLENDLSNYPVCANCERDDSGDPVQREWILRLIGKEPMI